MVYIVKAVKNFQTCEFTWCDNGNEELDCCIEQAADIVEQLDDLLKASNPFVPTSKEETTKKIEVKELASEKQVKFAVSLGLDETKAKSMSK